MTEAVIYQFKPRPRPTVLGDALVFHALWLRYWLAVWGL